MTAESHLYAISLESRLRPVAALVTALAHGGRNSRGQPLPNIAQALEALPDRLADLARWAQANAPASERRGTANAS